MKTIILTGGGTAGHVTPNLALIPSLKELGYEIHYIGSYQGIEKKLIENTGIAYHGISSGKLRRYFDLKNFSDPFRVLKGYGEAISLFRKYKPDVVFSKGGFVAVPVVLAAKHFKVPTIIHESDMTPGLANKICIPSAKKVCCNFPETLQYLPAEKAVLTGSPIRAELLSGDRLAGLQYAHLSSNRPIILVIGGSLGSVTVNNAVRAILPKLLSDFQIIHICGKGNLDESLISTPGYVQYEYVDAPLRHLFAAADLVISRAGANSICEILALRKPNILIPLSAAASRGDQILNANSFAKQGFSTVLQEEELTEDTLYQAITNTTENRQSFIDAMAKSPLSNGVETVIQLIRQYANDDSGHPESFAK
ncbi:MAG: undecaprenyldiphospho-muramoylpentapeptide beta-N-acetylglucosaminyltransferase [Lachnospiraceae bacterium]